MDKNDFHPSGTGLVNELLQVLGRWFFAVVLNGELVQAEITGEVAECGVIDDESALVLLVEEGANGNFERVDVV